MSEKVFTVRIDADRNDANDAKVAKYFQSYDACLVVHEYGDLTQKSHYQGYVVTTRSVQNVRDALTAVFPDVKSNTKGGRGKYSIGLCKDPAAYRRYCMKGTAVKVPEVITHNLLDLNVSDEWRQSQLAEDSKKSKCKPTIFKRALAHFRNHAMWDADGCGRHDVSLWLVKEYCADDRAISVNILRTMVNTICAQNTSEGIYSLAAKISEQL